MASLLGFGKYLNNNFAMNKTVNQLEKISIDSCMECLEASIKCAIECRNLPEMETCLENCEMCIQACKNCIEACQNEYSNIEDFLEDCISACKTCAEECEKHDHDHCKECALACRDCIEICEDLLDSL